MAIFYCGQKIKVDFEDNPNFYCSGSDYDKLEQYKDLIVLDDCNKFKVSSYTGFKNILWIEVLTDKGILKLDRSLPLLISIFNIEYDSNTTLIRSGRLWSIHHKEKTHELKAVDFGLNNYISRLYLEPDYDKNGISIDFDIPLHIWNKNEDLITEAVNKGLENNANLHNKICIC